MYCTECGKQVRPEARFCPNCGSPVPVVSDATLEGRNDGSPEVAPGPSPSQEHRSRRRLFIIVAAILVVVLAGGIGGYLVVRSQRSPQNTVDQVKADLLKGMASKGYDPTMLKVYSLTMFGNWALATINNTSRSLDDAEVVLKKTGGTWTIVAGPGTNFAGIKIPGAPAALLARLLGTGPVSGTGTTTSVPRSSTTSSPTTSTTSTTTSPSNNSSTGGSTTAATGLTTLTLPVHVLGTAFGVDGVTLKYPSDVVVGIPQEWVGQLSAYGVAGAVLLAPRGWTESDALIAADGSSRVTLHSTSSSAIKGMVYFEQTSASVGSAWDESARYFPWVQDHWSESGFPGPAPSLEPGLTEHFDQGQQLIEYSLHGGVQTQSGLEVNGVAHTGIDPNSLQLTAYPGLDRLEVTLPSEDHGLATVILNYYLAHENEYYVSL